MHVAGVGRVGHEAEHDRHHSRDARHGRSHEARSTYDGVEAPQSRRISSQQPRRDQTDQLQHDDR
jgi:hypothetical protein